MSGAAELREPVTQTRLHDPENGVHGNCVAACLASVTGAPIETFDHIIDAPNWWHEFEKSWMAHGYLALSLAADDGRPSGLHLASGPSPRGIRHQCVYRDGELLHDPHPSRAGLVEVDTWIVLVPWKACTVAR